MTDILGAIDASISLGERVYKVFKALRDAKSDMAMLEEEIDATLNTLETIKAFYQETGPSGFNDSSVYERQVKKLLTQLQRFQETCNELHEEYKPFLIGRSKYALRVRKIRPDKDRLSAYLENLELLLLVGNLRQSKRTAQSLEELEDSILTSNAKADFTALVDSLYSEGNPQRGKVSEEVSKPSFQPPTWIFSDPSFRQWNASPESSWLCCLGRQGAGKSSLATYLTRELQKTIPGEQSPLRSGRVSKDGLVDVGVAIYYYDYKKKGEQSTLTVLKSLCGQLLEQLWRTDPYVARMRSSDAISAKQNFASFETSQYFLDFLKQIIGDFRCTYIIVDALDENAEEYDELLVLLRQTIQESTTSTVKYILTSRDYMVEHVERLGAYRVVISPSHAVLKQYVYSRLGRVAESHPDEYSFDSDIVNALKNEQRLLKATEAIASAASGSYLLARIHVDTLRGKASGENLEERLAKLPTTPGIRGVMENIFDRINKHDDPRMQHWGRSALMWAICAKRSLTMDELRHAAATSLLPSTTLGPATLEMVPSIQDIVDSTCFLLEVDKGNSTVETHKSLRDYYDKDSWAREKHFNGTPSIMMSMACLRYLTLDDFQGGQCSSEKEWQERIKKYPFLLYASEHWGNHVQDSGERHIITLSEFFDSPSAIASASQALQPSLRPKDPDRYSYKLRGMMFANIPSDQGPILPPLHLATHFNLVESATTMLNSGTDAKSLAFANFSALFVACQRKHIKMVRLLLDKGADMLQMNGKEGLSCGWSMHCLGTASYHGWIDVVEELIRRTNGEARQALLLQQNRWGVNALHDAAQAGNKDVIDLLRKQPDAILPKMILEQSHTGHNALFGAMLGNHYDLFHVLVSFPEGPKLLLQQNKEWKDTMLHIATSATRPGCAKELLKVGEFVGLKAQMLASKQRDGKTPLHLAMERPYEHTNAVAQILLNNGANPGIGDSEYMNVLHRAAVTGNWRHMETLIERRFTQLLTVRNGYGLTPLQAGKEFGRGTRSNVIRMLFKSTTIDQAILFDVVVSVAQSRDRGLIDTALEHMPSSRMLMAWVIQYCLAYPLERIIAKAPDDVVLALFMVTSKSFVEGLNVILRSNPEPEIFIKMDKKEDTLLHIAASKGNVEVVEAIFDTQPETQAYMAINAKNAEGKTPWDIATTLQWPDLVLSFKNKIETVLDTKLPDQNITYRSPSIELNLPVPPEWKSIRCMRQAKEQAQEKDKAVPYLLSPPIPEHKGPITRITVRITGHDQGFTSYNHHLQGTFADCHAWVELSRYRDDALHWGERLTVLPRAKGETMTHTNAWDAERGIVGTTSQKDIGHSQHLAKKFLRDLQVGDRIAVVMRAEYERWECNLERAELEFFWNE